MKCDDVKELLSDLVSGDIEPVLAVTVEGHVSGCSECRETLAGLRSIWSSLDGLEVVEPPQFFHENLMTRVFAEADAREEAEARRKAAWDWRALFRPRSLGYAAAVLVMLLAGMGGLHYSKASLDPLGSLLRLLKPAPPQVVELSSSRAEWSANAQGGGTLIVYLRARPELDGRSASINCLVNLPADLIEPGTNTGVTANSETETSISIPVKGMPSRSAISVTISSRGGGQGAGSKTEPVTLMVPLDQPSH